jgi:GT2 family glycosyltransferase
MAEGARVSVIILNYNGLAYLKDCLKSLRMQTYSNFKTIVCDNASRDGSVEFLTKNYSDVTLVRNRANLGFAEGNNVAINYALKQDTDYIFLLNNDTEMEPDALAKLVETAESNESFGIAGPLVLDLNDRETVQEAGMSIDRFGFPMQEKSTNKAVSEVFFVSGCALLIKKAVLQTVGACDEDYFMFAEDLDLCWRAQLAGYRVVVNKASRIYHASGGSMVGGVAKSAHYTTDVRRIFLREKNTLRTLIKNYDLSGILKIVPLYVSLQIFESTFWFLIHKPCTGKNILRAIVWNLKVLPDTMRRRAVIQSLRKVGDCEITGKMARGYHKLSLFRAVGVPEFVNSKPRR